MSQAKVDKYKEEKKSRAKKLKRKKLRNVLLIMLAALGVGAGIGYPLGIHLYKVSYEQRKANATVELAAYDYWLDQYWDSKYYGIVDSYFATASTDSDDVLTEESSDTATPTDATSTDSQ